MQNSGELLTWVRQSTLPRSEGTSPWAGERTPHSERPALLERHKEPIPETCDVCKYAVDSGGDLENEHALTRAATMILLDDLADLGRPARMSSLAVTTFPAVGDVVHVIEPRHWHWAMLHEPDLQVVLRRTQDDE